MNRFAAYAIVTVAAFPACKRPSTEDAPRAVAPESTAASASASATSATADESLEERILVDIRGGRIAETTHIEGKDEDGRALLARVFSTEPLGLVHFDVMERTPEAWTIVAERSTLSRAIPEAHRTLRLEEAGRAADAGARVPRELRDGGGRRVAYYEITSGPLAGAIAWEPTAGAGFVLKSVRWIHLHSDHAIGSWLCHDHRIAGRDPKKPPELERDCQEAVREKIPSKKNVEFAPKGAPRHEPQTFADCTQSWNAYVEFDMPWGTWRRRFSCTYDPTRGRPAIYLE